MGSCREGVNLFTKNGRKSFFKRGIAVLFSKRNKGIRNYMWKDTFGKYICAIIGHAKIFETDDCPPNKVCRRCYKIIVK